ncbi:MAG TPA: RES family NAD+ phosphorylase [Opitutaceae bacterium]
MATQRIHDRAILDALEALTPEPLATTTWRIVRKGRDPLRGSAAFGRWTPIGEFEVLYTSLARDGALAEVGYRLGLEPVWPTRIQHRLHEIAVRTARTLRLADLAALAPLGVDVNRYESFDYSATRAIAAAAHFLEFDGLIVPSARYQGSNLVLFTDRVPAAGLKVLRGEDVNWKEWRKVNRQG